MISTGSAVTAASLGKSGRPRRRSAREREGREEERFAEKCLHGRISFKLFLDASVFFLQILNTRGLNVSS